MSVVAATDGCGDFEAATFASQAPFEAASCNKGSPLIAEPGIRTGDSPLQLQPGEVGM